MYLFVPVWGTHSSARASGSFPEKEWGWRLKISTPNSSLTASGLSGSYSHASQVPSLRMASREQALISSSLYWGLLLSVVGSVGVVCRF